VQDNVGHVSSVTICFQENIVSLAVGVCFQRRSAEKTNEGCVRDVKNTKKNGSLWTPLHNPS
jgi:hypothetical protein